MRRAVGTPLLRAEDTIAEVGRGAKSGRRKPFRAFGHHVKTSENVQGGLGRVNKRIIKIGYVVAACVILLLAAYVAAQAVR